MKFYDVLITAAVLTLSTPSLASSKSDLKFVNLIEATFGKPLVIREAKEARGKHFSYKSFQKKSSPSGKKNYLSNFLKLHEMNLIETKDEVHIVEARDSIKMHIPVFKENLPQNTREQMVVLVKTLPKGSKPKNMMRTLRSLYSKDGDLKESKDGSKLIISDWTSNIAKLVQVMEAM